MIFAKKHEGAYEQELLGSRVSHRQRSKNCAYSLSSQELVVNKLCELLNITVTFGNTDDLKPLPQLLQNLVVKVSAPLSKSSLISKLLN